jgi:formate dehydrogenase subunit gamma
LTDSIRAAAADVIARYASREGAALPILHALQKEFGYLPEAALPLVAEELNITRAEIYGIATFYHDFHLEPRGRVTVKLCRAEACQAMGGTALAEHAKSRLGVDWGETTPDGRVTLEQTFCLGLCACAPSGAFGNAIAGRLTLEKFDSLLAEASL